MDYLNRAKTIGKNTPDEKKSRDFCRMLNSIKKPLPTVNSTSGEGKYNPSKAHQMSYFGLSHKALFVFLSPCLV
jgi:hypothetical protein